ncbi:hypothetical protein [Desulfosporosinus sp. SB140]|uniref:hypothetical protein n=1 Tax=Desulfosporosinus paludis TaxID=3115649 RepID=UPI0038910341
MLTRSDKNYLLNMALVIVTIVCVFTGIYFDNGLRFAHEISGYLMAILILVHLVVHAQWIKTATRSILSNKKKLLALLLTIVISVGICSLLLQNQQTDRQERNRRGNFQHTQSFSQP